MIIHKQFYFIKSLFRSNVVFSQRHGNIKVDPEPYPPLSIFDALTEQRQNVPEVNLKNVQCERSDQKNEEDSSHGSKIDVAHPLLPNLVLHLDKERRELRSKVKRSEGEDLLVRFRLHHLEL